MEFSQFCNICLSQENIMEVDDGSELWHELTRLGELPDSNETCVHLCTNCCTTLREYKNLKKNFRVNMIGLRKNFKKIKQMADEYMEGNGGVRNFHCLRSVALQLPPYSHAKNEANSELDFDSEGSEVLRLSTDPPQTGHQMDEELVRLHELIKLFDVPVAVRKPLLSGVKCPLCKDNKLDNTTPGTSTSHCHNQTVLDNRTEMTEKRTERETDYEHSTEIRRQVVASVMTNKSKGETSGINTSPAQLLNIRKECVQSISQPGTSSSDSSSTVTSNRTIIDNNHGRESKNNYKNAKGIGRQRFAPVTTDNSRGESSSADTTPSEILHGQKENTTPTQNSKIPEKNTQKKNTESGTSSSDFSSPGTSNRTMIDRNNGRESKNNYKNAKGIGRQRFAPVTIDNSRGESSSADTTPSEILYGQKEKTHDNNTESAKGIGRQRFAPVTTDNSRGESSSADTTPSQNSKIAEKCTQDNNTKSGTSSSDCSSPGTSNRTMIDINNGRETKNNYKNAKGIGRQRFAPVTTDNSRGESSSADTTPSEILYGQKENTTPTQNSKIPEKDTQNNNIESDISEQNISQSENGPNSKHIKTMDTSDEDVKLISNNQQTLNKDARQPDTHVELVKETNDNAAILKPEDINIDDIKILYEKNDTPEHESKVDATTTITGNLKTVTKRRRSYSPIDTSEIKEEDMRLFVSDDSDDEIAATLNTDLGYRQNSNAHQPDTKVELVEENIDNVNISKTDMNIEDNVEQELLKQEDINIDDITELYEKNDTAEHDSKVDVTTTITGNLKTVTKRRRSYSPIDTSEIKEEDMRLFVSDDSDDEIAAILNTDLGYRQNSNAHQPDTKVELVEENIDNVNISKTDMNIEDNVEQEILKEEDINIDDIRELSEKNDTTEHDSKIGSDMVNIKTDREESKSGDNRVLLEHTNLCSRASCIEHYRRTARLLQQSGPSNEVKKEEQDIEFKPENDRPDHFGHDATTTSTGNLKTVKRRRSYSPIDTSEIKEEDMRLFVSDDSDDEIAATLNTYRNNSNAHQPDTNVELVKEKIDNANIPIKTDTNIEDKAEQDSKIDATTTSTGNLKTVKRRRSYSPIDTSEIKEEDMRLVLSDSNAHQPDTYVELVKENIDNANIPIKTDTNIEDKAEQDSKIGSEENMRIELEVTPESFSIFPQPVVLLKQLDLSTQEGRSQMACRRSLRLLQRAGPSHEVEGGRKTENKPQNDRFNDALHGGKDLREQIKACSVYLEQLPDSAFLNLPSTSRMEAIQENESTETEGTPTGNKRYMCDVCQQAFTKRCSLLNHKHSKDQVASELKKFKKT